MATEFSHHQIPSQDIEIHAAVRHDRFSKSPMSWGSLIDRELKGGVIVGEAPGNLSASLLEVKNYRLGRFNLLLPDKYAAIAVAYPNVNAGADVPSFSVYSYSDQAIHRIFVTDRFLDSTGQETDRDFALFWGRLPLEGVIRPVNNHIKYDFFLTFGSPMTLVAGENPHPIFTGPKLKSTSTL